MVTIKKKSKGKDVAETKPAQELPEEIYLKPELNEMDTEVEEALEREEIEKLVETIKLDEFLLDYTEGESKMKSAPPNNVDYRALIEMRNKQYEKKKKK